MISDVLKFPFKGTGKYILIIGVILSLILSVASYIPLLGIIIAIGASGYFAAYFFAIINSTASGKDEACDWPDFRDFWSDLVGPWLLMLSAMFFSFGPSLILILIFDPSDIVRTGLLALGFIHLPMAILRVAIFNTMGSAFWLNTFPVIMNCLSQYFILLLILGALIVINMVIDGIISSIPVLGWFLGFSLWMYSLMVGGRVLGLFYRDNRRILTI